MNVSFTGANNIGAMTIPIEQGEWAYVHQVLLRLTNEGTQDLDIFKKILRRYKPKIAGNLQLDVFVKNPDSEGYVSKLMFVNGKYLECKPQSLHTIKKIYNLMTKIANKPEEELLASPEYIYNKKFFDNIITRHYDKYDMAENFSPDSMEMLHNPENIKAHSGLINEALDDIGIEFLQALN